MLQYFYGNWNSELFQFHLKCVMNESVNSNSFCGDYLFIYFLFGGGGGG